MIDFIVQVWVFLIPDSIAKAIAVVVIAAAVIAAIVIYERRDAGEH